MPADAPHIPDHLTLTAPLDLISSREGKSDGPPKFRILANTGEPMRLEGFFDPVVIDLQGAAFDNEVTPIIADHNPSLRIGHTTARAIGRDGIVVDGVVSSQSDVASSMVADAKAGFPFQASVGAAIVEGYHVPAKESATVNGRTYQGPLIVAKRTRIKEISVTVLGADSKTRVAIAAHAANNHHISSRETPTMPHDFDNDRQRIAAEELRVDRIRAVAQRFQHVPAITVEGRGEMSLIEAKAHYIEAGLDANALELACIRAEYPQQPIGPTYSRTANTVHDARVLEAAVATHVNLRDIEQHYDERTLDAASRIGMTCLMDVVKIAAQLSGQTYDARDKSAVIKAAFSTASMPNVLSNVANKQLENAYRAFPSSARVIARKLSANDFKDHTGVRLTGERTLMEKVGQDGEIKHGVLTDASYTFAVETYGKMFGLTRVQMINDDLDALDSIPQVLGRSAATKLEEVFWTLVLANTGNYFHADNDNLLTGAGSVLASAGLASAVQKFLEQTDSEGHPIGVVPKTIVVPPALKATADELYVSRTLNVGGGSTSTNDRLPGENVQFGKYLPLASPWLGANGGLSGSDTAWYLFGDPRDVAAFGIAYLNNREVPTIELEDQPFNTLGVQWRGYIDFGVCQIDHRGAVKSNGA